MASLKEMKEQMEINHNNNFIVIEHSVIELATKNNIITENLAIQYVWKRIYSEWFPSSGFEQVEGPCMEKYFWDDDKYDKYKCEVWIPVRRK